MTEPQRTGREPAFNLPAPVIALIAMLLVIHAGQMYVLSDAARTVLDVWFAFIPLRFTFPSEVPGGAWPLIWTPVTHAFLHANWPHVLINSAWLAIFGTPVARRYGVARFYVAFVLSSIAGALAFALFQTQSVAVLVGASGGISGLTGVAVRFIFQPVVMALDPETGEPVPVGRHLATVREVFADTRARSLTLIWLALNAATPLLPLFGSMQAEIAWQAHIGGFLAGFFLAPLLEARMRG